MGEHCWPGAPPEIETAAPGFDRNGGSGDCKHVAEYSPTRIWARHLDRAPERHVRAFGAVSYALTELRLGVFGGGAWPPEPADALAATLASILRNLLGRRERRFLGTVALWAMQPEDRVEAAEDALGIPAWEGAA